MPRVLCVLLACALVLAGARAVVAGAAAKPFPRCYGAASRDTVAPCRNPALRLTVRPRPADAVITPYSPCLPEQVRPLFVCRFRATPPPAPVGTFALLGDSHAAHWRAGLETVARETGWRAVSITRTGCPFALAPPVLDQPLRSGCVRWRRLALRWFEHHPQVSTVYVSEHTGARVVARRGVAPLVALRRAYVRAWRALPRTVKRIVVIRDVPKNSRNSATCVERAIRRRVPAGPACALARSAVLASDPAVVAARALRSRRVKVIDLSSFLCSPRLCFPVIGGALVHKDIDHLTQEYSASLGPYLLRASRDLLTPAAD